jgi:DNA-binding XRE family transcriptional regulator
MKLSDYLKMTRLRQDEFAELVGISKGTLKNILKGKYDVRLSTALRIEKETKGKVKCKDLVLEQESLHQNQDSLNEK